jgi:L-amino acid N-acyltransferase YncA
MSMDIREAIAEDLGAIVEIYNAAIPARMATADLAPVTIHSQRNWFYSHSATSHPIWVIENQQKILGWLSLQPFYGRAAYHKTAEVSIYIAPDLQRQGIGRTILTYGIEHAPSLGITTLLGFIFGHNYPSLGLFTSLGFEKWGHLPQIAELDAIARDLTILGRQISAAKTSTFVNSQKKSEF